MADVLKLLVSTVANRTPAAATNTTVYTVPTSTTAMLSKIMICNTSATATSFRIALVESGGTTSLDHYIAYDAPIGGNETINFAIGAGLATGDYIVVYNTLATLTFTPMGIEVI
jgi:hypothetical protein